MQAEFYEKLKQRTQAKNTDLALVIAPRLMKMPLPMMYVDDPFLPFSKAIIDATKDLVCVYLFDFAAFLALGAAGAVALERAMAYARDEAVTILDGRFAAWGYAEAALAFGADAITMVDTIWIEKYFNVPDLGVLIARYDDQNSKYTHVYRLDQQTIMLGDVHLRAASEDILYRSRGEDFAEQVRAALEQMRDA